MRLIKRACSYCHQGFRDILHHSKTFARIFYRNAINIGLPIVECPEAARDISDGDVVEADFDTGTIVNKTKGRSYKGVPFLNSCRRSSGLKGLSDTSGIRADVY